jgi:hypothetical protein
LQMSHVGCANRLGKKKYIICVCIYCVVLCTVYSAKVDYSVFFARKWGEGCILMHGRYLTPTCKVFVLGSSDWWSRSCVLATSYAFGGKYLLWVQKGKV